MKFTYIASATLTLMITTTNLNAEIIGPGPAYIIDGDTLKLNKKNNPSFRHRRPGKTSNLHRL